MVHLLTGNLRGLSAARLRRRIAHDPALAQEWNELQAVTTRLQQSRMPEPQRPAPRWVSPRLSDVSDTTLRERTQKRRVVAALALALPVSGVIAAAVIAHAVWTLPQVTFNDKQGHVWKAYSNYAGEVRLYNTEGRLVGNFSSKVAPPFLFRSRDVRISIDGQPAIPLQRTGTYELHTTARNERFGYAQLVPNQPESVSPTMDRSALYDNDRFAGEYLVENDSSWAQPGLAGYVNRRTGLAWKVKGYAVVVVRYEGKRISLKHASRELSQPPSGGNAQAAWEEAVKHAPSPKEAPVLSWSIANPDPKLNSLKWNNGAFLFSNGRWANPVQSGTFTGYGRHRVLDAHGNTLVAFDVKPLGPLSVPPQRKPLGPVAAPALQR